MAKKLLALLLGLILCLGTLSAAIIPAFAQEDSEDDELKTGSFTFAPHTVVGQDLTDYYYYSDSFFSGSAFDYNEHLATMSMILAAASISSQDLDATYEVKSRNLEKLLTDLDFWAFGTNSYYMEKPGEQTMGVAMAYRVIGEGDDAYTVLAIVPRSAGYEREWSGNFTVGKEGVHEGFATGRDIILEFAKLYIEEFGDGFEGEIKIWTSGYSRGAGVANLLAASIVEDSQAALGLDIKQENVFAYTFGTPSTVQYADEEEKALLASNYANIWNVHADYDIVTFAPFRNWNFTYYGNTRELDVYNDEKKTQMLGFLKETNEAIYDLYTAENSSADPDNFMALMLSVGKDGISFLPADASYAIPNNQRDFLTERVTFLTEHLVPDRATYVDGGYQHALERLTSLYFGLNAEQITELMGGMSGDLYTLAGAYYCYFLSDFYLASSEGLLAVALLIESLPVLEMYIGSLGQDPEVASQEWYLYASAFLASEQYATLKTMLESIGSSAEALEANLENIQSTLRSLAVNMTAKILASGISALTMEDAEKEELLATMTSAEVTVPLTDFLVYLLLGTEDGDLLTALDPSNKSISIAATFLGNAGRYMRVHNNEIILSWLRTEDTYYTDEPHVHDFTPFHDKTNHGLYCSCGESKDVAAHTMGEWTVVRPATKEATGLQQRSCSCGYTESAELSYTVNHTVEIIAAASIAALGAAAGVVAVIAFRKRKNAD